MPLKWPWYRNSPVGSRNAARAPLQVSTWPSMRSSTPSSTNVRRASSPGTSCRRPQSTSAYNLLLPRSHNSAWGSFMFTIRDPPEPSARRVSPEKMHTFRCGHIEHGAAILECRGRRRIRSRCAQAKRGRTLPADVAEPSRGVRLFPTQRRFGVVALATLSHANYVALFGTGIEYRGDHIISGPRLPSRHGFAPRAPSHRVLHPGRDRWPQLPRWCHPTKTGASRPLPM